MSPKLASFWLPQFISLSGITLGIGDDIVTLLTQSKDKLRELGVMWPDEVNRILEMEMNRGFLIEGLLPINSIAVTAGDSGIGKSPWLMLLALSMAAGKPFLGMDTKQSVVLYFDLENSLEDSQKMRDALLKFLGLEQAPEHFLLMTEPPETTKLDALFADVKPKLVIIDSLRSFRPEVTENNTIAGQWLKDMRKLVHTHKCTILFNHHLRKKGESPVVLTEDVRVMDWLQEMEGPRALVNQTDVRIAIEDDPDGLKVKWNRRVYGDSSLMSLERVFEDGEPLGYKPRTGVSLLKFEQQPIFLQLPPEFQFKDARAALGKGDNVTNIFLKKCVAIGVVEKTKSGYRKLPLN